MLFWYCLISRSATVPGRYLLLALYGIGSPALKRVRAARGSSRTRGENSRRTPLVLEGLGAVSDLRPFTAGLGIFAKLTRSS